MPERWVTAEDMAEAIKKAKVARKGKLGAFTRKHNHIQQLIDGGAPGAKLKEVYEELTAAFGALEISHKIYVYS